MRHLENIVFGLIYFAVCILYGIQTININLFIGLLGSIATIYFGILKLKVENDILFKELFKTFNDRYNSNMNDIINNLKIDSERKLDKSERNIIIDYFNLCAEEYLWYKKKRIPTDVWTAWKSGILENLKIKQVAELYKEETSTDNGKKSFYGLIEELKK
jgi:hypothetical protein